MLRASTPDDRPRVLLADDDPLVRHVLAQALGQQGLQVEEANDGIEALDRLGTFEPDVIVTDLNMPRCSGAELCRRLKADAATRHIPVLIVTGAMFREQDLLNDGCYRVLTKPITAQDLTDAVLEVARRVGTDHKQDGRTRSSTP